MQLLSLERATWGLMLMGMLMGIAAAWGSGKSGIARAADSFTGESCHAAAWTATTARRMSAPGAAHESMS